MTHHRTGSGKRDKADRPITLTPAQVTALIAFEEGGRWYGPSVPTARIGRFKGALAAKGLLERMVSSDNYGRSTPFYRLTSYGMDVRRMCIARSPTPEQPA
ncbi:hypothetical protein GCM10011393_06950 [Sphingopyxis bauzanensis]|nr:hypothetical protein GCM10011393_06950 [Sphingopyxis bauzanensis]